MITALLPTANFFNYLTLKETTPPLLVSAEQECCSANELILLTQGGCNLDQRNQETGEGLIHGLIQTGKFEVITDLIATNYPLDLFQPVFVDITFNLHISMTHTPSVHKASFIFFLFCYDALYLFSSHLCSTRSFVCVHVNVQFETAIVCRFIVSRKERIMCASAQRARERERERKKK